MTLHAENICLGLLATALLCAPGSVAALDTGDLGVPQPHDATPACVHVRAEARRAARGYDHWVFIHNDCDLPAACDVSTDQNPETMTLAVQPRSAGSVLTSSASPVKKFTPYVTCQLGPAN